MSIENLGRVKANIKNIYERKRIAVYAKCLQYAAYMLNYFHQQQAPVPGQKGKYWTNRTAYAAATVFFIAFLEEFAVGIRGGHMAQYGVYLELANDRKYEAIRPILQRYIGRLLRDIKALYVD